MAVSEDDDAEQRASAGTGSARPLAGARGGVRAASAAAASSIVLLASDGCDIGRR